MYHLQFSQNKGLKRELFATYPKTLVEASPYDRIWGIGLLANDSRASDQSKWKGHNLLGYILTFVRDTLMLNDGLIKLSEMTVCLNKGAVRFTVKMIHKEIHVMIFSLP